MNSHTHTLSPLILHTLVRTISRQPTLTHPTTPALTTPSPILSLLNPSSQSTFSTHPLNPPSHPPSQPVLSTHPLHPPSQPPSPTLYLLNPSFTLTAMREAQIAHDALLRGARRDLVRQKCFEGKK